MLFAISEATLSSAESSPKARKELIQQIIEGRLCDDVRPSVWKHLTKTSDLSEKQRKTYQRLLACPGTPCSAMIQKDTARTFPQHPLFQEPTGRGQLGIAEVLTAYAQYDPEVGYCQGMAFIVGTFLKVLLEPEAAFWAFVFIMYEKNWRSVFKSGTPKLAQMIDSLRRQLESHMLDLYLHFGEQDLDMSCFSGVLMTVFSYRCEETVSFTMMDLFLVQGEQVLFTVLLKMLQIKRERLLRLEQEALYTYCIEHLVSECFNETRLEELTESLQETEFLTYTFL